MSISRTYTKKDLINKVGYKLNLNYDESKIITDCVLDSFKDFFINTSGKNRVEIRNFGIFNILLTKERTNARNPKTKESVIIPERKKVVFKPSKRIKEILKSI
tara:strand:- start:417 stop:725 length:309 start_codon:yes stop_codon:yes gene_type:complete